MYALSNIVLGKQKVEPRIKGDQLRAKNESATSGVNNHGS
jgi:hypothetical protein